MTRERLNFLVLAALLHDVGKLLERGEVFSEAREDSTYLGMCPSGEKSSTHLHSAHTAAFCDWLEQKFDCLRQKPDKAWKTWCAAHHINDETGLEASVIRIADRLSAREREEGTYYKRDIHKRTFLEPVTERVFLHKNDKVAASYRFPITRLISQRESFFPVRGEELGLEIMGNPEGAVTDSIEWTHLLSKEPLTEAYRDLSKGLMDDLSTLAARWPDMGLQDLIPTVCMLLEKHTAMVPSATNVRHPDISLFDHMRSTAAIAQALYLFQWNNENSMQGILLEDDPKWLLACGDFSGIQKFIYNLTNKGAAKGLRGRSFYVQYVCSICADFILKELNLTPVALLYNSGGKFYLLLPAHLRDEVSKARQKVNEWLLGDFKGEVFLGLGVTPVTSRMFNQGEMHGAWKAVSEDLERDRTRRFSEFLTPQFFEPETEVDPTKSCSVCGSRGLNKEEDKCGTCKKLESLGSALRDTEAILTVWEDEKVVQRIKNNLDLNDERTLFFSALGVHCLLINKMENRKNAVFAIKDVRANCAFLNEFGEMPLSSLPIPNCALSGMYLGKWESGRQVGNEGNPWDFENYAENAQGIKRLGVLRMDVDNLGLIFARGLSFPKRKAIATDKREREGWGEVVKDPESHSVIRRPMASISRMVTLSRQLNHFFSGYVPSLLRNKQFDKCQVIYTGGDDLFVIGAWDQLPKLAKTISNEFREFCCCNPDFSISGGLILQRARYPIYKGAQLAGHAEKMAKDLRRRWKKTSFEMEKNAFCFLGVPVLWEDFELAEQIKGMLECEIESNKRGFLSFLLRMVHANKLHVQSLALERGISIPDAWKEIEYGPWRWRTAYQLRRRYKDSSKIQPWVDVLFAGKHDGKKAILPVFSWLELPLRWTEYIHREKEENHERMQISKRS